MTTNPSTAQMAATIAAALPHLFIELDHNVITLEDATGQRYIVTVKDVFTPTAVAESGFLADAHPLPKDHPQAEIRSGNSLSCGKWCHCVEAGYPGPHQHSEGCDQLPAIPQDSLNWSEDPIADQAGYLPCGCHGSQSDHSCKVDANGEVDHDGDEEDEPSVGHCQHPSHPYFPDNCLFTRPEDPSSFDGGYGPNSYHARAMRKPD